jgi:DNA-binding HxlR family transcriptional regulator
MQDLVGRKWHLVLVQHLLRSAPLGFSELEERIDGISAKVLSESLSDLESRGVVDRRIVSERPIRVEYSLSGAGKALEPVVESIRSWGQDHLDAPVEDRT